MSSSHNLSELLKFAKDVPILNTGISDNATEYSTYPVKEHNRLLSSSGKPMSTPLNSLLAFRSIKIPTDRNDPNFKDKAQLESYKKNALTLTFRGTRTAPASKVEWEEYLLHLVPLVIEHPKILLSESKNLSQTMSKLYRASSDFIGDASLSVEQRSTLKVKSLCLPILADDPWEQGAQEGDEIDQIVLEELGINVKPRGGDDKKKFDNMVVQYEVALAFLRELLNHTFLRAIYHTSTRQAQGEYKEVQRTFVTQNALARNPTLFTAKNIIDHITANCTCDNSKSVIQIKNGISALIRYKGQDLISWFQTFQPPVTRYRKAIGIGTALNEAELKALWKEHFAKQITIGERTVISTFQASHLSPADIAKIAKLSDGIFDDTVLYTLLSALSTSFESYSPDNTVMVYLKQHSQALRWEHRFDFRPPKEREKDKDNNIPKNVDPSSKQKDRDLKRKKKPDRKSSRSQSIKMTDKSTPNPKRISSKDYCKTPSCRKRGTHKNHTHSECKFKESTSTTKHPNLGNAPAKKQRNAKTNASQPVKNAFTPPVKSDERKCYTCGKPGHLSNACPDKGRIKAGAQSSLNKNKSFMALWQSSFTDAAQQQCATRCLKSWGDDVCSTCLGELSFDHRCDPNDIAIAQHASSVRDILSSTPLLQTIESAHAFERTGTEKPAPISMGPSFFHDAEGQDDTETDENEDETASSGNESQDLNRDEQYDNSDSDSVASSDSYRSRNSNDTDRSNDS